MEGEAAFPVGGHGEATTQNTNNPQLVTKRCLIVHAAKSSGTHSENAVCDLNKRPSLNHESCQASVMADPLCKLLGFCM